VGQDPLIFLFLPLQGFPATSRIKSVACFGEVAMARTWQFSVEGGPAAVWPARVSVPVPAGEGRGAAYAVRRPDGSVVPAQARPLTCWPDGSPRWVQLDFQANGAGACTAMMAASDAPVALPVQLSCDGAIALPVQLSCDGAVSTITVGRLTVTLDAAAGDPIRRVAWDGRELAGPDFGAFRVEDEGNRIYRPVGASAVQLEASGPLRVQCAWESACRDATGQRSVDVRVRVEFLAGVEGFRLSWQFLHRLPGRDLLHLRAIDAHFALPALAPGHAVVVQEAHSSLGQRRAARVRKTVPILIDHTAQLPFVEDTACLDDTCEYPYFYNTQYAVGPVTALEGDDVAVVFALRNLEDQRPKTVTVSPGALAVGLWPRRAGLLRLPQGRSSAHQFAFRVVELEQVDDLLFTRTGAYLEPAVGWLDPADSAAAGLTWDAPRLFHGDEPGAGLFHYVLTAATQRYTLASGMFDFGDSAHAGYTQTYAGGGMRPYGERNRQDIPMLAGLGGSGYAQLSRVAVQSLQPVWANNEYDAIYGLALEALRTQSRAVLHKLTAVSRHQIEVDFVHYSDHWQQHRGTPCHTFDHTASSTAYPSHQWTQGLYYYYCLTGDDDVPEVIRAICDYNLRWLAAPELEIMHYFNREIGWAIIALVFGYELTGEAKYREATAALIREMARAAGREDFDDLTKLSHTYAAQNETLIGAAFAVNTIVMGVCLYHKATGEDWAWALLERWVRIGFDNYNHKATGPKIVDMFPECFSYVWECTGAPRYLEESLWQLTMFLYGYGNPWGISASHHNTDIDAKLYGRVYRGLVHNISACAKAGLLPRVEGQILGETAVTGGEKQR